MGAVCVVAALVLGIYCEWRFLPFVKDDSLSFFLQNLHNLPAGKQLMIGLGAVIAFFCGRGRSSY